MTSPRAFHHALLRPAILQVLRAQGYHAARPTVIDSLTDLATRYLELICEGTARHTTDNDIHVTDKAEYEWHFNHHDKVVAQARKAGGRDAEGQEKYAEALQNDPAAAEDAASPEINRHDEENMLSTPIGTSSIVDVRMALQDVGAFLPERDVDQEQITGKEDTRGVDAFIAWATGPKFREIRRVALDGLDDDITNYLTALKKKHSKTAEDSKYAGTLLGKLNNHGVVHVEGKEGLHSVEMWEAKRRLVLDDTSAEVESRPPSSGLSSIGATPEEMDLA